MDVLGFIGHRVGVSDNMKNANFIIWKLIILHIQDQANRELILNAKKASHATPLWKSLPAIDILRVGASGRLMLAVFVINQLRDNLSFRIDISFVSQAACYDFFPLYCSASFHRHKPIIHFY